MHAECLMPEQYAQEEHIGIKEQRVVGEGLRD
jgi:hypothetical protein